MVGVSLTPAKFTIAPLCAVYSNKWKNRDGCINYFTASVVSWVWKHRSRLFSKEFKFFSWILILNTSKSDVFFSRFPSFSDFETTLTLVFSTLILGVITVAINLKMSPYRPKFCVETFKEICTFPAYLPLPSYSYLISNRADGFIIDGVSSTPMMGSYHVGSELAMLPSSEMIAAHAPYFRQHLFQIFSW